MDIYRKLQSIVKDIHRVVLPLSDKPLNIVIMGKLSDSLLSGSSGRTGRVVVANVAGTEILRVRPRKRTQPPTPKQVLIQKRMKDAYDFILSYKSYASKFFGVKVGMRSCFNLAMTNILNAIELDFTLFTSIMHYNRVMFSSGPLLGVTPSGISSVNPGAFKVDWINNAAGNPEREADLLQIVYIAEDEVKSLFVENAAQRMDATFEVTVSPALTGKTVHVWMAFKEANNLSASVSVYVGNVVIT